MLIGLPKEIKNNEFRVGLTPASVRELTAHGHAVAVQAGAAHLEKSKGGMGILLGGVPGVAAAHVVINGAGVVGTHASRFSTRAWTACAQTGDPQHDLAHEKRRCGGGRGN